MGTNYGNHGKKGRSGRKSIRVEAANMETLEKMYFNPDSQDEIEQRIRTGKFSIKDRHILNALEGDQKAITPIFSKLFPDKMEVKDETNLKIDV